LSAPILQLNDVCRFYGAIKAVDGVSLAVADGARLGVIGPNGAGKSTLFGLISGRIRPTSGRVFFKAQEITGTSEITRAHRGIAQSFQHSSLFPSMTCLETIVLAAQRADRRRRAILPRPRLTRRLEGEARLALDSVGLGDCESTVVGTLAHGEKRQLDVALALATKPSLLLLDEPTAGMSAEETRLFVELVHQMPQELTIVIVEHDMEVVFGIANQIAVLTLGRVLATGTPEEIQCSHAVEQAYLGAAARRKAHEVPTA
jgi:branched-chain amino acid transport system ATP-binding protein